MKKLAVSLLLLVGQGLALAQAEPATNRFVTTADGTKIHCLEKGSGRAILFVPGWTMPAEIWQSQLDYFGTNFHVVAMDPRCQGDSSQNTNGLTPMTCAQDIKAVVDDLKLGPIVLVAWSLGVMEALSYVDQFGTSSVAGMVLVDGMAGWNMPEGMHPQDLPFLVAMKKDRATFADRFTRTMFKHPQSDDYYKMIAAASLKMPTDAALAIMLAATQTDMRPALEKIDKPTLFIVATIPKSVYEPMQKKVGNSRVEVFETAGHAAFADEPEHFNSLVNEFLNHTK